MGVIGYGRRISGVCRLIQRLNPDARIVAITDVRNEEIKKEIAERDNIKEQPEDITFYTDAEEMLAKEDLAGVLVGTRCSLHAQMARKVAPTGLPLYLEKPVATTMDDLKKLKQAFDKSSCEVVVSFPLRVSPLVRAAREVIASGRVGSVEHVQAVNNVPYGSTYYRSWYRDYNETGGLWLQKATHDFDYINHILDQMPALIAAVHSQRVMGKRKPAGLTCDVCDELEECPESPYADFARRGIKDHYEPQKRACAFGKDIDPRYQDNGSALIEYTNGVQACYSQNFFARRDAASRGATLIGYHGTIQFDWYTEKVKVTLHHVSRTETIDCAGKHGHGGGDVELAQDFLNVMRGKGKSRTPISAGILSVLMCLKARRSALSHTFEKIDLAELDA